MSKRLVIITVATLTALVSPALAAGSGHHHKKVHSTRAINPRAFGNARGEADGGFRGYPTDYLYHRFGDFQAQGEL